MCFLYVSVYGKLKFSNMTMDADVNGNLLKFCEDMALSPLFRELSQLSRKWETELYLAGGTLRDLVLNREIIDIDFAVSSRCLEFSGEFSKRVNGTYVILDKENKTSRVVIKGYNLDFTEFRGKDIQDDLSKRDFSINAMAIPFSEIMEGKTARLLDPFGGLQDIKAGLIRALSKESITHDPLRMVRAYRLAATYDFRIEERTREYIKECAREITKVSQERITTELTKIFSANMCYPWVEDMVKVGLVTYILPEIQDMKGVIQNGSHHLDVYDHSLLTLKCLEEVINGPQRYFRSHIDSIASYLRSQKTRALLKWAALFHDLGKAKVREIDSRGKITFYYHEQIGSQIFLNMAQRLKLSKADARFIQKIILLHMRPLHIMRPFMQGTLTPKGIRRFIRQAEGDLIGVFVVTMADSLAGKGPLKPADAEVRLAELFDAIYTYFKEKFEPITMRPRLITGRDLIEQFHLTPGPVFGKLLREVEEAYMEGIVTTREQAIEWLSARIAETEAGD